MVISGKDLSARLKEDMRQEVSTFPEKYGRVPHLVVILVGDDPASASYVKGKAKASEFVGIRNTTVLKPDTISEEELLELPQSFTRADLQKLAEQKARMAEEAERWSEEHADDPDIIREDVEYIDGEDESFADAEDAARLEGGTLEDLGSVTAKGAPLPPSQPKKKKDKKHKKDEAAKDEKDK